MAFATLSSINGRLYTCPACGQTDKRCKPSPHIDGAWYCWNTRGGRVGDSSVSGNLVYVKELEGGMGGLFVPRRDNESYTKPSPFVEPQKKAKKVRQYITDDYLDENYRKYLSVSTLNEKHRNQSIARGVDPDELLRYGFRSWKTRGYYPGIKDVPGISQERSYDSPGIFLPIYTPWNKLVCFQLAPDSNRQPKYKTLRGSTTLRKNTGAFVAFTYGWPEFPTPYTDYGTVHLSVEGSTVKAKCNLTEVATAYKSDKYLNEKALLLGLQLALSKGIRNITVTGYQSEADATPQYQTLRTLTEDLIGRFTSIHYTGNANLTFAVSEAQLEAGEQFLNTKTVGLTEGIAKPKYAALKHGGIFLGAAGYTFTNNDFVEYLNAIEPETVIHYPDAGAVLNTHAIPSGIYNAQQIAEQRGCNTAVAWWEQTEKTNGNDIDDFRPNDRDIKLIPYEDYFEMQPRPVKERLDKNRFFKTGVHKVDCSYNFPRKLSFKPALEFAPGQRVHTYQTLLQQHKYIHDKSFAGSGKSHTYRNLKPEDINENCQKILIMSNESFKVNWPGWVNYCGRDRYGRAVNPSDGKVKRAEENTEDYNLIQPANCRHYDRVEAFIKKGLAPTQDQICKKCPAFKDCKSSKDGYLYQRKVAQAAKRVSMHPAGFDTTWIKGADGKAWNKSDAKIPVTAVIIDDIQPYFKQYNITYDDLQKFLSQQPLGKLPIMKDVLQLLQDKLFVRDENGRYKDQKTKEVLKGLPDLTDLKPEDIWFTTISERDLIINHIDSDTADEAPNAWLQPLINAIQEGLGLQINNNKLTVTRYDERFLQTLRHPGIGSVVIGDATARTEYLEMIIGEGDIPLIAEAEPVEQADVIYTQIFGNGDIGYKRSKNTDNVVEQLKTKIKQLDPEAAVIDIKDRTKSEDDLALTWRGSSRGSNAAEKVKTLLSVGTPRANINAKVAEWELMTRSTDIDTTTVLTPYPQQYDNRNGEYVVVKKEPKDPDFAQFLYEDTYSEIWQAFQRLRAARRAGEQLQIVFASEYPLPFAVKALNVEEFVSETQNTNFRTQVNQSPVSEDEILVAANDMIAKGFKITYHTLAAAVECSVTAIRSHFAKPGKSWKNFVQLAKIAETLTSTDIGNFETVLKNKGLENTVSKLQSSDTVRVSADSESAKSVSATNHSGTPASVSSPAPIASQTLPKTPPKPHDPRVGQLAEYKCVDGNTRYGLGDVIDGVLSVLSLADGIYYPIQAKS